VSTATDRLARIRAYADDHHDGECQWASDVMTLADGGGLVGEPKLCANCGSRYATRRYEWGALALYCCIECYRDARQVEDI